MYEFTTVLLRRDNKNNHNNTFIAPTSTGIQTQTHNDYYDQ